MAAIKKDTIPVEVDMVPLIDVISLLLMFLVITGDMARSATNVKMTLPRADMAISDSKSGTTSTEGRIVVQMEYQRATSRYMARIEGNRFELVEGGSSKTLIDYLEQQITKRESIKAFTRGPNGEVPFPVKLRIPADAPMREVERVVMTMAKARLVNVQYAAEKEKDKK